MGDEVLLHYRILEQIGKGGMGVVYKALDTRLDRPVAIKTLPSINDPKRRRQFIWEARAAAGLRHPNIVVVHDIASDKGTDFIVMEFIPGHPLSFHLAKGALSVGQVLRYSKEIASALEAAHAAGIIHRDIKPSNILVTPEGSIKLVDFGLARLQQPDIESQSAIHVIAGTCEYMSPEQAQAEDVTAQSDIFSFGAVLYEMVTGERAFGGKSAAAVLAAVLRDDPPSPATLAADVPPALEKIIQQCLRKDPRNRYQHVGDVRLALEEVAPGSRKVRRRVPAFWRRVLMYSVLAGISILVGGLLFSRYSTPVENSAPIPLTSFPGHETSAAWSPDGREVAFMWDGEKQDNEDIYLLQPGSSAVLRLTTDPGDDVDPSWSPDGRRIAYAHAPNGPGQYSLEEVSPLGGPTRPLLTSATPLSAPAWTPDNRALAFSMAAGPGQPAQLWTLSVNTGERSQLTSPPSGIPGDSYPAFSPDGRTLAFARKTAWRTAELYTQDLRPDLSPIGPPRRMTELGYVGRPAWTPDGSRILFEAHHEHVGIWQMDRNGDHLRPVFGVPDTALMPAIAKRQGGHTSLVFTTSVSKYSIYRQSTEKGPGGPVEERALSSLNERHPRYSNDGKRLAFSSDRSGYLELWVANADGSQPVQLTDLRHQLTEMGHWSPSDDTIAFISQDRGSRQIYVISSSGGVAVPITHEDGVKYGTGWAWDGSAYYYDSLRSGQVEVWKASRSGSRPQQMTTSEAENGFESQRGTFYYWRRSVGKSVVLMRRTPDGDQEIALAPRACSCMISPAANGAYYRTTDTNDVYFYDENTGQSSLVLKHLSKGFNQFTISPDGHWFATGFERSWSMDLMIIESLR